MCSIVRAIVCAMLCGWPYRARLRGTKLAQYKLGHVPPAQLVAAYPHSGRLVGFTSGLTSRFQGRLVGFKFG
eukprot:2399448-Rhodomonas_salina.1